MKTPNSLNRRYFLRGLGTAMTLPFLESLHPLAALAKPAAASAGGKPLRMAFFFVPNGVHMSDWTPTRKGADFELPTILEPLRPLQRDLLVLSGLTHDKGRANGDGPGDHARSAGVFLTGAQPLKSEGAQIRAGTSIDQLAAVLLGAHTRFPSLELGAEGGRPFGKCDSGYSCAYSNNISWKNETTPVAKETNPRAVFERLFSNELQTEISERDLRRERYRKSILDFVREDAKRLESKVSYNDRQKLHEYLTGIREIEGRIERMEADTSEQLRVVSEVDCPEGIPEAYQEHLRLMGDMLVLAFQTDVTRVATFMFANAGSNRSYRQIGVNEGHHSLSHHQGDPVKLAKISRINRFHTQQLAYILQRLKSIPEGEGSLLDHCMVVYGSGICDGNRHNNENLPILLAGNGGGRIQTGRHVQYPLETPVCNLFVSMMDTVGFPVNYFGDSTGSLPFLSA